MTRSGSNIRWMSRLTNGFCLLRAPGYVRCCSVLRSTTTCRVYAGLLPACGSALLKNVGRRNTRETGLAKWFSTVASERAAGDAVQIHGANGYSDEYPVGRFFRNCKGAVIYEGTREIHKLMQADYLLGYRTDRLA